MKKLSTLLLLFIAIHAGSQTCVPNTNAIVFNGTSDYINFTTQNNLDPTTAITIEAWINASAWGAGSAEGTIFCKHSNTSASGKSGYVLRAGANGTLSFNIAGDSAGLGTSIDWREVLSTSGTLTTNTWTHVAGTFDGTMLKIYVNGVMVNSAPFTGTIFPSPFPPRISRWSDTGQPASRYWHGKIDEIRVWNRALTQTEIADSMNTHIDAAAQTGLIGYWRINEGTGTSITDETANANTGTITGGTWTTSVPFNNAPPTPLVTFNGIQLVVINSCPNYQWYLNGVVIPGANAQVYTPMQNGSFTVVDTNGTCTNTSAPYNVIGVSVEENNGNISLDIKQSSGLLEMHLTNYEKFNTLQISDITGRNVYQQNINGSDYFVNTENIHKGIYMVKFLGEKTQYTRRIIIQ
jgi:hypothetical protein